MSLDKKLCLICDDVAIIEVISIEMQTVPLCGVHWLDYCERPEGMAAEEVRKFFDDGAPGDEPQPLQYIVEQSVYGKKTDQERPAYRTDEWREG